jgi:hypothetical protein
MTSVAAGLAGVALLAGQMIDGHVHRVHNGGVLVHCGGHVVEVVVRRRGEVVEGAPSADVEAWLWTEKDAWLPPAGRSLRLREGRDGKPVTLQVVRDHFEGKLTTSADDGSLMLEVELTEGSRTSRVRLLWTNLDERERMNDGRVPLRGKTRPAPRPPERRPPP